MKLSFKAIHNIKFGAIKQKIENVNLERIKAIIKNINFDAMVDRKTIKTIY